jgi:large subunit ribosomal protein L25
MMAEGFQLKADVRERTGKGAARALRRDGKIPAVIYGDNKPPLAIVVPQKEVSLALYGGGFLTNTWEIEVGGERITTLARDYQLEPVKDKLIHVDFLRVSARSRVTVEVPVSVTGEDDSPGIRNDGVLALANHTVAIEAPATRIPDTIEIDISGLEIGATVHSSEVALPADVKFATEEAFAIATITAPVGEVEEEPAEEAAPVEEEAAAEGEESSAEDSGEEGSSEEKS